MKTNTHCSMSRRIRHWLGAIVAWALATWCLLSTHLLLLVADQGVTRRRTSTTTAAATAEETYANVPNIKPVPEAWPMPSNPEDSVAIVPSNSTNDTTMTRTTKLTILPPNYTGHLAQMWTCSKPPHAPYSHKLIFVHVFKTAGSSFRFFLDSYAIQCHRGISILASCSGVAPHSLQDPTSHQLLWESSSHEKCVNEFSRFRHGRQQKYNAHGAVSGKLLQHLTDMLVGHLPIGIHEYWMDMANQTVIPQYVAFFRDPVAKFVSGRVYVNQHRHWTLDEAVQHIQAGVWAARRKHKAYYFGCEKYLTTPSQKVGLRQKSMEERVQIVLDNLLTYNCLVGIVERMTDSLALLQHVIDGDLELTREMQRLDTSQSTTSNRTSSKDDRRTVVNKSALSTQALVTALQQDTAFYPILLDYLKYERQVYDYALEIHRRQVQGNLVTRESVA